MGTTAKDQSQQSMEARLGAVGKKLDQLNAQVEANRDDIVNTVDERIDALRASQAQAKNRFRRMRDADEAEWNADVDELDRELDDLDDESAIAEAELEADLASDEASFTGAVQRQLDAYSNWFDRLQARSNAVDADVQARRDQALGALRDRRADAAQALAEFERSSSAASSALRDGVHQAVADLDRAVKAAVRAFNT